MEYIEYNGTKYPCVVFPLKFTPRGEAETVRVSVQSLRDALEPFDGDVEASIDNSVNFYVDDYWLEPVDGRWVEPTLELVHMVAKEQDAYVPNLAEWEAWETSLGLVDSTR
jgi:hypothetical protein